MPSIFLERAAAVLILLWAGGAAICADVLDTTEDGFTIKTSVTVSAPPERAYAALVDDVGKWWDSAHTYSQDSTNLSIDAKPQGCWCERLARGGVRHMTVVLAWPGKMIRFEGGLGPLQSMGVAGSMTWSFRPAEKGSTVELVYAVGGYSPNGFKEIAPAVDSVLRLALERYKRFVETGNPQVPVTPGR
jgi:uncharacterized protein YndB with AHSA1/START domain